MNQKLPITGDEKNLPVLLSAEQVKRYLHLGNEKLYELLRRRDFPSFQIGKPYYILQDEFIEWVKNQTKKRKF